MFNDSEVDKLGRKNHWPCIVDSFWEEPWFCMSYGASGCPCSKKEDRPCGCNESGFLMDMVPVMLS